MNGLIACHIQQEPSVRACIAYIHSIANQTQPLKRFNLSWSASDEFDFRMTNLCQYFQVILSEKIETVRFYRQPSRKKQFQHYKLLCQCLRQNKGFLLMKCLFLVMLMIFGVL